MLRLPAPIKAGSRGFVHILAWTMCLATAVLGGSPMAAAQPGDGAGPLPPPFSDPADMLQRMFGADRPEDRARLAEIEISWREELQTGDQAAEAYLRNLRQRGIPVSSRGKDVEYLRQLAQQIRPNMEHAARYRNLRVYVAEDDSADARSFPGGTLVFHRGMLDFAESEAALAGVVGHELSHMDRGHQLDHLRRIKLAQQSFRGGFDPQAFFRDGTTAMRMFTRPFRPEDETQADLDGAAWAYRMGYDPREMANLFRRMHQRDGGRAGTPAFLRTHPYHLDRFRSVIERYEQLRAEEPRDDELYIGRENLRQRTPMHVRRWEP